MVEDHPVSYIGFHGTIPEGNYGAGTVDIWDEGKSIPNNYKGNPVSEREALKALKNGNLKFSLNGKHLKGELALVQLKDENNWLLIKHRDKYATDEPYSSEHDKPVKSHKTGSTWGSNKTKAGKKVAAKSPPVSKKKLREPAGSRKQSAEKFQGLIQKKNWKNL